MPTLMQTLGVNTSLTNFRFLGLFNPFSGSSIEIKPCALRIHQTVCFLPCRFVRLWLCKDPYLSLNHLECLLTDVSSIWMFTPIRNLSLIPEQHVVYYTEICRGCFNGLLLLNGTIAEYLFETSRSTSHSWFRRCSIFYFIFFVFHIQFDPNT